MIGGQETKPYEKRLKEQGMSTLKKRRLEGEMMIIIVMWHQVSSDLWKLLSGFYR